MSLHLSLLSSDHNIPSFFTLFVNKSKISCTKEPKSGGVNSYIFLFLAFRPYCTKYEKGHSAYFSNLETLNINFPSSFAYNSLRLFLLT